MIVVGADSKLCTAMERLDEFGLASKFVAGAGRKALEGYAELLDATICDGRVDGEERHALECYRRRHGVTESDHVRMLAEIGWSEAEFLSGAKESKRTLLRKLFLGNIG